MKYLIKHDFGRIFQVSTTETFKRVDLILTELWCDLYAARSLLWCPGPSASHLVGWSELGHQRLPASQLLITWASRAPSLWDSWTPEHRSQGICVENTLVVRALAPFPEKTNNLGFCFKSSQNRISKHYLRNGFLCLCQSHKWDYEHQRNMIHIIFSSPSPTNSS